MKLWVFKFIIILKHLLFVFSFQSEVVEAGLCLKQCSLSCGMKITHSFLQKRYCELTGRI